MVDEEVEGAVEEVVEGEVEVVWVLDLDENNL
jgi:hypothetical protein